MSNILKEKPKYIDTASRILEYVQENKDPDHSFINDTDYDSHFTYSDVGVPPQHLYRLETYGVLEKVFSSNSTKAYAVRDINELDEQIKEVKKDFEGGPEEVNHSFPDRDDLDGIFDDVVGYDDAKWLLKKAISSDETVNILLVGPPGCGKTVFLRCIAKLEGAKFISGKKTSSAGFTEEMFDSKPRFMCVDELDDMDNDDQQVMSDYTEEGRLVETKGNDKRRELVINTKTFAAANKIENIIPQIDNRFTDLHFDPYNLEEFKEVCVNILPDDYDQSKKHSEEIAEAVWEIDGFANVRKAEDVASLSDGEDPKRVVSILENYSRVDKSWA
jgi:ATPase subunit of ABC transporter with duplicated ATPase domains